MQYYRQLSMLHQDPSLSEGQNRNWTVWWVEIHVPTGYIWLLSVPVTMVTNLCFWAVLLLCLISVREGCNHVMVLRLATIWNVMVNESSRLPEALIRYSRSGVEPKTPVCASHTEWKQRYTSAAFNIPQVTMAEKPTDRLSLSGLQLTTILTEKINLYIILITHWFIWNKKDSILKDQ